MNKESVKGLSWGSLFAAIVSALGWGAALVLGMHPTGMQVGGFALILTTLLLGAAVLGAVVSNS